MMIQNIWDATKVVLRGKYRIQLHFKKQETSQINNKSLHLKKIEKAKQTQPKISRRKKIIKIRVEINDVETKNKTKQKTI